MLKKLLHFRIIHDQSFNKPLEVQILTKKNNKDLVIIKPGFRIFRKIYGEGNNVEEALNNALKKTKEEMRRVKKKDINFFLSLYYGVKIYLIDQSVLMLSPLLYRGVRNTLKQNFENKKGDS